MNVREALAQAAMGIELEYPGDLDDLAVHVENALRASAEEMAELLNRVGVEKELVDRCVTTGAAVLASD